MGSKRDRKIEEKSAYPELMLLKIQCEKKTTETVLQGIVTDIAAAETDSMKITSYYATAHPELAAGHWLMCQGSGRGSMGLCKFEYWILMMLATVQ